MRAAREHGINFLDDARYNDETGDAPLRSGYSEVVFGELFRASGWKRAEVIVANKLWWEFWPNENASAELDGSLKRMGLDYLDLAYAERPREGQGIEQIVRDAHRASAIIRQTRELYKKAVPEKTCLDINQVIDDAITLVRGEDIGRQVSLQLELAPGLPAVRGDRVQLQQVIINLVMNGIEAMASVDDAPRTLVVRSNRDEADQIVVAVQDLGRGIDPQNAKKLFSPFFTTKPNGMGMGLSICRSIIEAHGGRVWASGNTGPGTTFQFTLTAEPAIAPQATQEGRK